MLPTAPTSSSHNPTLSRESSLSGLQVRRLMHQHRKTIRAIATRHGITMKRVREVRSAGVSGFLAEEWHWMITNVWPTDAGGRWLA